MTHSLQRDTVERVNARLDGCNHEVVRLESGDWRCCTCGQAFIPLLEAPVLVGDWGRPRLADAGNPEWTSA